MVKSEPHPHQPPPITHTHSTFYPVIKTNKYHIQQARTLELALHYVLLCKQRADTTTTTSDTTTVQKLFTLSTITSLTDLDPVNSTDLKITFTDHTNRPYHVQFQSVHDKQQFVQQVCQLNPSIVVHNSLASSKSPPPADRRISTGKRSRHQSIDLDNISLTDNLAVDGKRSRPSSIGGKSELGTSRAPQQRALLSPPLSTARRTSHRRQRSTVPTVFEYSTDIQQAGNSSVDVGMLAGALPSDVDVHKFVAYADKCYATENLAFICAVRNLQEQAQHIEKLRQTLQRDYVNMYEEFVSKTAVSQVNIDTAAQKSVAELYTQLTSPRAQNENTNTNGETPKSPAGKHLKHYSISGDLSAFGRVDDFEVKAVQSLTKAESQIRDVISGLVRDFKTNK